MNRRTFLKLLALLGFAIPMASNKPAEAAITPAVTSVPVAGQGMAFRHKGCKTEIFRYIGTTPLSQNPIMRSSEWLVFGKPPLPFSIAVVACPDCGVDVAPMRSKLDILEKIEGAL